MVTGYQANRTVLLLLSWMDRNKFGVKMCLYDLWPGLWRPYRRSVLRTADVVSVRLLRAGKTWLFCLKSSPESVSQTWSFLQFPPASSLCSKLGVMGPRQVTVPGTKKWKGNWNKQKKFPKLSKFPGVSLRATVSHWVLLGRFPVWEMETYSSTLQRAVDKCSGFKDHPCVFSY